MKTSHTILSIMVSCLICFSCSEDDDSGNDTANENNYADLSNISGDEGSRILVTQNNQEITYAGANVLGWEGTQLLNLNYSSNLRLLHDDFETITIWFSIPADFDFVETAVGTHGLHGYTVQLQDTQFLDAPIVEMYINLPGEADRTQFFGSLEIRRNVEHLGSVLDMVGTFEITRDGQTINGLFWKKEVANW